MTKSVLIISDDTNEYRLLWFDTEFVKALLNIYNLSMNYVGVTVEKS